MIVLDVPLLYETKGDQFCDAVIVVSAPNFIQRSRVFARDNMTEKKFIEICNRQLSDKEKRFKANYIIPTGLGKGVSLAYIKKIIQDVKTKNSCKWLPGNNLLVCMTHFSAGFCRRRRPATKGLIQLPMPITTSTKWLFLAISVLPSKIPGRR